MSKKTYVDSCPELTEEEISESYEDAMKNGEVTDLMGDKDEKGFDSEYDPDEEKVWSYTDVQGFLRHLRGEILTIVDAGYGEMEKTKFAKDLIKKTFLNLAEKMFTLGNAFSQHNEETIKHVKK